MVRCLELFHHIVDAHHGPDFALPVIIVPVDGKHGIVIVEYSNVNHLLLASEKHQCILMVGVSAEKS